MHLLPIVDLYACARNGSDYQSMLKNGVSNYLDPFALSDSGKPAMHYLAPATQDGALFDFVGVCKQGAKGVRIDNTLDDNTLLCVLEYVAANDLTAFFYPPYAVAHDGVVAGYLGLPALSGAAHSAQIARALQFIMTTGAQAHFSAIYTAQACQVIALGKQQGLHISADVSMTHLFLDENAILGFDVNARIAPPLASADDCKALRKALKDGTLDAICSLHTPCTLDEKHAPFAEAKAGISAHDSFVALCLQALEFIDIDMLNQKIHHAPARILQLSNIDDTPLLIDTQTTWGIDDMRSPYKHMPFAKLVGRVR